MIAVIVASAASDRRGKWQLSLISMGLNILQAG
jgi:hypothetical protein